MLQDLLQDYPVTPLPELTFQWSEFIPINPAEDAPIFVDIGKLQFELHMALRAQAASRCREMIRNLDKRTGDLASNYSTSSQTDHSSRGSSNA